MNGKIPTWDGTPFDVLVKDRLFWSLMEYALPDHVIGGAKASDTVFPLSSHDQKYLLQGDGQKSIELGQLNDAEFFQTCHFSAKYQADPDNPIYVITAISWGGYVTVRVLDHWLRHVEQYGLQNHGRIYERMPAKG